MFENCLIEVKSINNYDRLKEDTINLLQELIELKNKSKITIDILKHYLLGLKPEISVAQIIFLNKFNQFLNIFNINFLGLSIKFR
jgi:hypothetical protein